MQEGGFCISYEVGDECVGDEVRVTFRVGALRSWEMKKI